jgi:hypothetical protein
MTGRNDLCALPDCWAPSAGFGTLCQLHATHGSVPPKVTRPVLHCTCPEPTPVRRVLFGGTECGACGRVVVA